MMNKLTRRPLILFSLGFVTLLGAVIAASAWGSQARSVKSSVVATVKLPLVLEKLDQRANAEAGLKRISSDIDAEQERRSAEIKTLTEAFQALAPEDSTRPAKENELARIQSQFRAWALFSADKMDVEKSLLLRDLYKSIKQAVAQMSAAEGFDVVLVDDSQGDLQTTSDSRLPRESQIWQQIVNRRLLYVNPTLDITDDLIARMNNAFNAAPGN